MRVQHRGNASLGDGDCLLLHCFVDGNTIVDVHLVKLIDAHDATISQNHCSALESKSFLVSDDSSCQSCCTRAFAAGVHSNWGSFLGELQELTLRSAWIAEEKHVDVSSHARAIGEVLARPSEEQARQRSLHILNHVLLARTD